MRSLWIAVAMYSRLPAPRTEWDKKSLSWALCWLPAVGAAIGALLYGWLRLWTALELGALGAAGAVLLPIAVSGAIHMDGFCDTCDALSSRQSRERKLEILKDSHAGAFAAICCGLYLLVFYAAWREIDCSARAAAALAMSPVLSRVLSALAAVSWENARGSGLLAVFTAPVDGRRAWAILLVQLVLAVGAMLAAEMLLGGLMVIAAGIAMLFYRVTAFRQFGGITGDTEGWFLQICECAMVLAAALGQKLEGVL